MQSMSVFRLAQGHALPLEISNIMLPLSPAAHQMQLLRHFTPGRNDYMLGATPKPPTNWGIRYCSHKCFIQC